MSALLDSIGINPEWDNNQDMLSEEEEEVASLFEEPDRIQQEIPDEKFVVQAEDEENPADKPDEEPYIPTQEEIIHSQEEAQVAGDENEFEKIVEENMNKKQLRGKELARYVSELRKSGKVRKAKSKNKKANIFFPIDRIIRQLKKEHPEKRISDLSGVFMSAVLEYLTSEILDLSGSVAQEENKKLISPHHILVAIKEDPELVKLLKDVTLPFSGVLPSPEFEKVLKKEEETNHSRDEDLNHKRSVLERMIPDEYQTELFEHVITQDQEYPEDAEEGKRGDRQQEQQQQQQQQQREKRKQDDNKGNQGFPEQNGSGSNTGASGGDDNDDRGEKRGQRGRKPKQQQNSESTQSDDSESDTTEVVELEIGERDREAMRKIGRKGGIISGQHRRQRKAERERAQSEASEYIESERSPVASPTRLRRRSIAGEEESTPRRSKGRQGVKRSPGPDLRKEARGRRGRKRADSGINIRDIQVETGQIPKSRREEQEEREAVETKTVKAPRKRKSQDITPTKQTTLDESIQPMFDITPPSKKRTRAKKKPEAEYAIEERSHFDYEVQIHNDYHYNIKCNSISDIQKLLTNLQQRNKEVRENVAHISLTGEEDHSKTDDQDQKESSELFEKQMSDKNPKSFEKRRTTSESQI
jgi:histone H2A